MSGRSLPRVIVTRPAAQAGAAVRQLEADGLTAVALPLIEIVGVGDTEALGAIWKTLASHRLLVFVSANAVLHFFAARPPATEWPAALLAAAPGPGTSAALHAAGVDPDRVIEPAGVAAQLDSEALWQRLAPHDWHGASVVVVRGGEGRDWLLEQLAAAGARVDAVTAYQRQAPAFDDAARKLVDAAIGAPRDHVWLFSSSQAIDHLEAHAGSGRWRASSAVATHPRIAARAREAGFGEVREAGPGLGEVVACIQSMRP